MSPPSDANNLKWRRDERITVPSEEKEQRIAIRRTDWHRVKRSLENIDRTIPSLSVWYSLCFGMAATAFASVIPLYYSQGLPSWVCPLFLVSTISAAILGFLLLWLDSRLAKDRETRVKEVMIDIKEIEDTFIEGNEEQQGPGDRQTS